MKLSDKANKIIFVYGAIQNLIDWGVLDESSWDYVKGKVNAKGIQHFDQLEADNYEVSPIEILFILSALSSDLASEHKDEFLKLTSAVVDYYQHRDKNNA